MLKRNNKERVKEEIIEDKLINIFNIIPNITDKTLDYMENNFEITNIFRDNIEDKRKKNSRLPIELLFLSSISAKMKQQHSISELPLALTSKNIINKLGINVYYDTKEGLLKESNIRAILKLYDHNENEKLNFNNYFINYFNKVNKDILTKANIKSNMHIYDCSILDVNIDNENYEGSTVTIKGNKKLRGYKIGALRGITPNGGVIEEICMSTAKDNDFQMSKDAILNSSFLNEGDYLLEDRGFLSIEQFRELNKKGIFMIIPAKKDMEIHKVAVETAKEQNDWIKHPNGKRENQEITIVKNMEENWLTESDKKKKPSNLKLDYKINCCVIRFSLKKEKIKSDGIFSEKDGYGYAVIITNNTELTAREIISLYEQRPEIEEDFRQLKDFWGLNEFRSTNYNIISFSIISTLFGYNFYQIYKESEEGKIYIGKNFIVEEKHGFYVVKGVKTVIVTEHYFGFFEQSELLDLYVTLDNEKRELIKKYLIL